MAYCVHCGVELGDSLGACPLCNTPVLHLVPGEKSGEWVVEQRGLDIEIRQGEIRPVRSPFPAEKTPIEEVRRKDLAILWTALMGSTALVFGLLNLWVFSANLWSLAVVGLCLLLWVALLPVWMRGRWSVYVYLALDGAALLFYLYLLGLLSGSLAWVWGLGWPIVLLNLGLGLALAFCVRRFPLSFLTMSLYVVTAVGIYCAGLELLVDRFLGHRLALGWSAITLTVLAVADVAIITVLSRRRLRGEVRRRLHF